MNAEAPSIPRPMVMVALYHLAGVAMGVYFAPPAVVGWLIGAVALGCAAVVLHRSRRIHGPLLGSGLSIFIALAAAGVIQGTLISHRDAGAREAIAPWCDEQLVIAEGTLAGEPRVRPRSVELVLHKPRLSRFDPAVAPLNFSGDLLVTLSGDAAARFGVQSRTPFTTSVAATSTTPLAMALPLPLPGQALRITAMLARPQPASSPGDFDEAQSWRGRGIFARAVIVNPASLELGPAPSGPFPFFLRAMRGVRAALTRNFDRNLDVRCAALARGIFLGEADSLDPETAAEFRAVGLAHLLVVAGLHTGFVLLIALGLARLIGLGPRAEALLGLITLLLYAALTGFRPPVVRAAAMGGFLLGGVVFGRFTTSLAGLALAEFVTLLTDPRNLLRIDWQLSYVCVLSILILAPHIFEWLNEPRFRDEENAPKKMPDKLSRAQESIVRQRFRHWLVGPFAVTLSIQVGLLPLQLHYFGNFYLFNTVANIVAVPLAFVSVIGIVAVGALGWFPGIGWLAGQITTMLLRLLIYIVGLFNNLDFAIFHRPPFPLWGIAVFYFVLLIGAWLRSGRGEEWHFDFFQRRSFVFTAAILLGIILWMPAPGAGTSAALGGGPTLDCYALDVGQGDGLVVRFPNGRVLVIDAGPVEAGSHVVAPFLQRLGIKRIDYLIATHADADHIGGIPYLLEHFEIGTILEGADTSVSRLFAEFHGLEASEHLKVVWAVPGMTLGGVEPARVKLLGPVPGADDNNASVVAQVSLGDSDFLFTGDLEAPGERALLEAGRIGPVEVLKVGHHGSRTSTSEAFLLRADPELALVSVGAHNRYGHPAPEIMQRLQAHHVLTERTDESGTLRVRTDGHTIEVDHFAGNN